MATRRAVSLGIPVLLALVGAGPSRADMGKWEVGFTPGWAMPIQRTGDFMKKSYNMQFSGTYQIHEWFAVGAEGGYSAGHALGGKMTDIDWDSPADNTPDSLKFESSSKLYWINLTPVVKIGKWIEFEELLYRPYIVFGMGLYHFFYKAGWNKIDGYTSAGRHISEQAVGQDARPQTGFGGNIGCGIDQQVFESFHVGIDVRIHHAFSVADFTRDGTADDDFDFIIPALRFYYVF
ncbi:MAG: outer membrane beta-barrel protein [Elusimicrobia bacterium]|nr:outer membrane beta-barrel protein [Elusimicrobiota bacterium]